MGGVPIRVINGVSLKTVGGAKVILAFALLLAGLLYYWNIPGVSSQGPTIVSKLVSAAPVDDPNAAVWAEAVPVDVPLSAQLVTSPRIFEPHVGKVMVRSVHDGNRISFLLEWSAPKASKDLLRHEDFRDSAAIQFAVTAGEQMPYVCMGQQAGAVNIWHWKADWEQDLAGFRDIDDAYPNMAQDAQKPLIGVKTDPYPLSPYQGEEQLDSDIFLTGKDAGNIFSDADLRNGAIENLVAEGFGTSTTSNVQNVRGKGVYSGGNYKVIFSRALSAEDGLAQFVSGKQHPIAFAVWNGAQGDSDGMKSVSSWYLINLEAPIAPAPIGPAAYILPIIAAVVVAAALFLYLKSRKRGVRA